MFEYPHSLHSPTLGRISLLNYSVPEVLVDFDSLEEFLRKAYFEVVISALVVDARDLHYDDTKGDTAHEKRGEYCDFNDMTKHPDTMRPCLSPH